MSDTKDTKDNKIIKSSVSLSPSPTEIQKKVVQTALDGKNIWIYGGPNTGKTYTIRLIEAEINTNKSNLKTMNCRSESDLILLYNTFKKDKFIVFFKEYEEDPYKPTRKNINPTYLKSIQVIGSYSNDKLPLWVTPENYEIFHFTETF